MGHAYKVAKPFFEAWPSAYSLRAVASGAPAGASKPKTHAPGHRCRGVASTETPRGAELALVRGQFGVFVVTAWLRRLLCTHRTGIMPGFLSRALEMPGLVRLEFGCGLIRRAHALDILSRMPTSRSQAFLVAQRLG